MSHLSQAARETQSCSGSPQGPHIFYASLHMARRNLQQLNCHLI